MRQATRPAKDQSASPHADPGVPGANDRASVRVSLLIWIIMAGLAWAVVALLLRWF